MTERNRYQELLWIQDNIYYHQFFDAMYIWQTLSFPVTCTNKQVYSNIRKYFTYGLCGNPVLRQFGEG